MLGRARPALYSTGVKLIGLTGGIASGKSLVSEFWRELDVTVLDADAVYHELITPQAGEASPLARAIGDRFPGVLTAAGTIDRATLGKRVFGAPEELETLGTIAHPAVAQEVARRAASLAAAGKAFTIYDVPLLFERGLEVGMDGVILVWVPKEIQIERLMARDGIDEATALEKIGSQMPVAEKRARAAWIIDNSGSPEETRQQVDEIWRHITRTV